MVGTSWLLVTQHATNVTASLMKIVINKWSNLFLISRPEVQILSPLPFKTMGYGLGRAPLLSSFFLAVEIF